MNKRFQRLGRAKLKYMSEIADSKASFEGDLAVKNRKMKKQSTSSTACNSAQWVYIFFFEKMCK